MSRWHVRCSVEKCKTRRVLKKHPDLYESLPPCSGCGGTKYRIDNWMNSRDTRAMACACNGYVPMTSERSGSVWQLHRLGSKYCWFRKDGTQRMEGDEDFADLLMEMQGYNPNKEM